MLNLAYPMKLNRIGTRVFCLLWLVVGGLIPLRLRAADVLPGIPKGTIAIHLDPIVTGLAAPAYAINPPDGTNRLFVVEQRGLLLVLQNGALLPTPALDIQSLVSPPLVPTNANDERGLLGLAFHPGFGDSESPGYRTLYTYNSQLIPVGVPPTYVAPNGASQGYQNVVNEWKIDSLNAQSRQSGVASRNHFLRQKRQ